MQNIAEMGIEKPSRPIRAIQFGEENFLRAFVDYMIDILNEKTNFNGSIAILKPIEFGSVEQFEKQNGLYTVYLRGLENGKETIINMKDIHILTAMSQRDLLSSLWSLLMTTEKISKSV